MTNEEVQVQWAKDILEENQQVTENQNTEVATLDEDTQICTLSEEEKKEIVDQAALSEEQKGILGSLIELNKTAAVLKQIDSEESVSERNKVLNVVMENFIQKRFMSNLKLESLKEQLIESVIDNMDNLDILTRIDTMEKIHNMTQLDVQKAGGGAMGMGNGMPAQPGVNITLNNASNGGTVDSTTNTNILNVNNGITAENLKEVASLNATMKSMKESGAPRKINPENSQDTSFTEHKE